MSRPNIRVGLISDTHGTLRGEAIDALRGSDFIIHAGDIGNIEILEELALLAPVTAVRGNNDTGTWAAHLPATNMLEVGKALIYVIHDLAQRDLDPAARGISAVISGHSHRSAVDVRDGMLYVNPGSAGPRRFSLPVSVGTLDVMGAQITPRLITLAIAGTPKESSIRRTR